MGRRAVTNPNKIESERERARNRRFLKRQMQQTLVREEYSGHSGVRMVDPTRNLVLVGDASRHHVGPDMNIISPSTHQVSIPISTPVSAAHGSVITAPVLDNRASCCPTICDAIDPEVIPSSSGQLIDIQNGTQQAAAPEDVNSAPLCVRRTAPLELTRALTRQRVREFRDRRHRSRIPPTIPSTEPRPSESSNHHGPATTSTSVQCPFVFQQADVGSSSVESQDSLGDDTTLPAAQPRNETLQSFINSLRQNTGWTPEFLDPYKRAYDQIFKVFYSSKCNCTHRVEGNEAELADSLRERVEQLRQFIPPLSTAFGETGSYDPSSSFQQWKSFLADEPSQPLSFSKSSQAFCHPGQPALSLSRQWDIDSIWFGAKGLQAIQSPNSFRLSFLPSAALNISKDEIIQPHGLDLARTRHIKLGTFNAHSVPFSAFVFFPNAAKDMTSSTQNALSLERQKDLYDHVIIPAAFEAVPDPCRQELPRTYEIAYAKSRSFQEKPGNNRWKPGDVNRAVHLQYTIPAENLAQFWSLIVEKANSFRLTTKSGVMVPYFRDPKLLFQSHDLKNTFGRATLIESLHYFQASVLQAFDPVHMDIRSCWIDIGTRDYVATPPSSNQVMREPYTLFWKSQCHPYLHEQLSRCAPTSPMNAQTFQRFMLRDLGDYQVKAKRTRASNPGHPDERKPGIIRAKAYSCHKEVFAVMFSEYELFGSGLLPLLALNQSMISDLSSADQGRHQAPTFHVHRNALSKAWDANKRHIKAAMDARNSTNYGIRKEMTFRLDVILTMWHDGYFEPSQNPHMAQGSLEISPTSTGTNHQPFWVISTKDINLGLG